jgi:hypothetical protein
MIGFGFSARHFQQVEAERPIGVTTLLLGKEGRRHRVARHWRESNCGRWGPIEVFCFFRDLVGERRSGGMVC